MKIELFIECIDCLPISILIIYGNNKLEDIIKIDKDIKKDYSELLVSKIKELLKIIDKDLKDLTSIYFLNGPDKFMKKWMDMAFVKSLYFINNKLKIYSIPSLKYLSQNNDCVVYIEASNANVYLAAYKNKELIIPEQIIEKTMVKSFFEELKKVYPEMKLINSFEGSAFDRFRNIFDNFVKIKNIIELSLITLEG